jgi:O-antigen/teichoic acid export membrane protein
VTAGDAERSLGRNVFISALGLGTRGAHLLLLFALGRLFGPAVVGRFLVGLGLFEIAGGVVTSGFVDGTVMFVSRGAVGRSERELADAVATALLVGGALAALVGLGGAALAAALGTRAAGEYAAVLPSVPWLAAALLPALVSRVAFAASTAFLRMEWEALVGAAGPPLGVLAALPAVRALGGDVRGLFVAFFVAQTAVAILAVAVLAHRLGGRALARALVRPRLDGRLVRFALPQGLNMAASAYVGRLDVLTLAASGLSAAAVGVYGAVAAVVVELRQVRMVVSGALAPVVARHHEAGDKAAIGRLLSRSAAGVAAVAVPVALAFVVLRRDVVALVAPSYAGDAAFALVLVVGPLVNCLGGLAGNFLVYLLRNRWNLANALVVAGLGTLVFPAAVARWGLVGAALAAAAATSTITLLENVELAVLEGVRIRSAAVRRAAVTAALAAFALAALGPPAGPAALGARVALAVVVALAAALVIGKRVPALRPARA